MFQKNKKSQKDIYSETKKIFLVSFLHAITATQKSTCTVFLVTSFDILGSPSIRYSKYLPCILKYLSYMQYTSFHLGGRKKTMKLLLCYCIPWESERQLHKSVLQQTFFYMCRAPPHLLELIVDVYWHYKHYYKHFRRGTVFSYFHCEKIAKLLEVK